MGYPDRLCGALWFHQNHNTDFDRSWRALMRTRRPNYATRKTWAVKSHRNQWRKKTLSEGWGGGGDLFMPWRLVFLLRFVSPKFDGGGLPYIRH